MLLGSRVPSSKRLKDSQGAYDMIKHTIGVVMDWPSPLELDRHKEGGEVIVMQLDSPRTSTDRV
jgi:hypothetical protein